MGNWRTVNLSGSCDVKELDALKNMCTPGPHYEGLHCLSITNGLSGLGDWVGSGKIDRIGNLAERDYSVEDVAEQFKKLVAIAPSLALWCDCGDDYESLWCVASIRVKDGIVNVFNPRVKEIKEVPKEQLEKNIMEAMGIKRR